MDTSWGQETELGEACLGAEKSEQDTGIQTGASAAGSGIAHRSAGQRAAPSGPRMCSREPPAAVLCLPGRSSFFSPRVPLACSGAHRKPVSR